MKITILASSRGKVPSVYVGKTFEVTQIVRVGDALCTGPATWNAYEGVTSTGRNIRFTDYAAADWADGVRPTMIVHREGFVRGTWIPLDAVVITD